MNTLPKEVDLSPPPPKTGGPEFYGASRTNYQFIGNTEDKKMGCYQQNPRLQETPDKQPCFFNKILARKKGGGQEWRERRNEREIYKLKTYEPITTFEFIWIMIQTIKTFLNYKFSNNWKCEH